MTAKDKHELAEEYAHSKFHYGRTPKSIDDATIDYLAGYESLEARLESAEKILKLANRKMGRVRASSKEFATCCEISCDIESHFEKWEKGGA